MFQAMFVASIFPQALESFKNPLEKLVEYIPEN